MARPLNVSNSFRTAKRSRNEVLREAAKEKSSIRGFLLGFAACVMIVVGVSYGIAIRLF